MNNSCDYQQRLWSAGSERIYQHLRETFFHQQPIINGTCTGSGCGGGGGGAVASVFGRTGIVVSATNDYTFSQIGGSLNLATQGTGLLPIANGGTGTASPGLVGGTNVTVTGTWPNQTITSSATAATAFSAITGSTNTGQALVIGAGSSLGVTGGGTIAASSAPFSGLTGNLGTTQGPILTGILKDTAGTISVATAGTDYLTPSGSSAALSVATTGAFGVVKPDGTTITVSGGVISSATASLADCTDTPVNVFCLHCSNRSQCYRSAKSDGFYCRFPGTLLPLLWPVLPQSLHLIQYRLPVSIFSLLHPLLASIPELIPVELLLLPLPQPTARAMLY